MLCFFLFLDVNFCRDVDVEFTTVLIIRLPIASCI